ncbi:MAG: HAMP domain-containing histidine kinase [Thermomicrobiales bacterium]|nr:HAMP domain-containing histidine kinase [Thermomicrobiales bacterium]
METKPTFTRRCRSAAGNCLRMLLVYPLVKAYRRRTRTKLSWRLAGSHFATVFVSVIAICLVGVAIALIASRVTSTDAEAGYEAWDVAQIVEGMSPSGMIDDAELSAIFQGIATGQLSFNPNQGDITIQATAGDQFKNIRTISLIGLDGTIRASSDPELIGQSTAVLDPEGRDLVDRSRAGERAAEFEGLTERRDDDSLAGAHGIYNDAGQLLGVVLVDKSQKSLPEGFDFAVLVLTFVLQFGVILLITVGVPAVPVGIVFGIRRARAISRPIQNLANTADRFAGGDLAARVTVESRDEIGELQRGFNQMADLLQSTMLNESEQRARAEHALVANRDLIANVSHELRTPVALIRGHLEALETDPDAHEAYLRIALRETDRLERLVEELFQLSRLEAHQFDLDIEPFDAGSAVRSAVESLVEPARREAGLTLLAQVAPGNLTCNGDRLRFEQVLLNLIRNALHFTPEGGIILVSAERDPSNGVTVEVRDTGIGIAPEHLPHVFDRFFRADSSRARAGGGAGLGLAIAKELIEAMGGTIDVASVIQEGTVFTLRLPVVPSPTGMNGRAPGAAAITSSPAACPRDHRQS